MRRKLGVIYSAMTCRYYKRFTCCFLCVAISLWFLIQFSYVFVSRMCFPTVLILNNKFSIKDIATTTRLKLRDEEVCEEYISFEKIIY